MPGQRHFEVTHVLLRESYLVAEKRDKHDFESLIISETLLKSVWWDTLFNTEEIWK